MRILVPLDTSQLAASALPPAERLAGALDGELLLVTVLDAGVIGSLVEFAEVEGVRPIDIVELDLKRAASQLKVPVTTELLIGDDPAVALIERIAFGDIDMVVMASHGRSAVQRWMLGSVSERVLRNASVPVTVVPAPWKAVQSKAS